MQNSLDNFHVLWLNCLFFQQGNSSKEFKISSDVASSLKSLYFIIFITLYNCRCKSLWYNEQSCYKTKNIEYLLYRSLTRTVLGAAILVSCLMLRWSIGISERVKVIKDISDTFREGFKKSDLYHFLGGGVSGCQLSLCHVKNEAAAFKLCAYVTPSRNFVAVNASPDKTVKINKKISIV